MAAPALDLPTDEQVRAELDQLPSITLCGSIRHADEIARVARGLRLAGHIVYAPSLPPRGDKQPVTAEQKQRLAVGHRIQIERHDEVRIVNPDGRIGDDTAREIRAAIELGKPVTYLWPVLDGADPTNDNEEQR